MSKIRHLMSATDTVKAKTVYWYSDQPDMDGSEYANTADLDTSTIRVIRKKVVRGKTDVQYGMTQAERDQVKFAWRTEKGSVRSSAGLYSEITDGQDANRVFDLSDKRALVGETSPPTYSATEQALNFHSSRSLSWTNSTSYFKDFHATGTFSLLIRYKLNTFAHNHCFIGNRTGRGFVVVANVSTNEMIMVATGSGGNTLYELRPTVTYDTTSYHTLLITGDGTNVEMYLDGSFLGSSTITTEAGDASLDLVWGEYASNASDPNFFEGFCDALVIDDKYWTAPERQRWRDWSVDAIPEDKFGTRYHTDWGQVTDGVADGQRMVVMDANGNEAAFRWSTTTGKWRLQSTGHEWVLLEDWSSGSLRPEIWTEGFANEVDDPIAYTVEPVSNRITLPITSAGATNQESLVLTPFFEVDENSAEFRIEANADTPPIPGTGSYGIRSISYFNTIFDDAVQSALHIHNTTGYEWVAYNRPVGGGSTTEFSNSATAFANLLRLTASSYEFGDEVTNFYAALHDGVTLLGSTHASSVGFSHTINADPQKHSVLVFNQADVNHTMYVGKIWIRK